jgi:hypothetical protein
VTDAEVNNMVGEAPGPINFTQMVTLFAEKMAGGKDGFISRLFFSFHKQYLPMNNNVTLLFQALMMMTSSLGLSKLSRLTDRSMQKCKFLDI